MGRAEVVVITGASAGLGRGVASSGIPETQVAALEGAGQTEEAKRIFRDVGTSNFNSVGFALVRADALKRAGAATTG